MSKYEYSEVKNIYGDVVRVNQFEISEVVYSRLGEILNLAKKEIRSLTSRNIDYAIITGERAIWQILAILQKKYLVISQS